MDVPTRKPRKALDVVRELEDALVALERSFAALDTDVPVPQREIGSEPEASASRQQSEVGKRAPHVQAHRPAPLRPEEHRRLMNHVEALLEDVRQLADFLAGDVSDPDPGSAKPD